jgi:ribonuclease E
MGYDLSRYETDMAEIDEVTESGPVEPSRLAGAGDPDGIDDGGELDAETDPADAAGGRRRARRGGARRRTRP